MGSRPVSLALASPIPTTLALSTLSAVLTPLAVSPTSLDWLQW